MNSRLPNQITVERGIGETRVAIWRGMGNRWKNTQDPYLARQLSVFSPRGVTPTSETSACPPFQMVMQEKTQRFILVRAREGPTSSGEERLYYLAPKCLYRGEYKSGVGGDGVWWLFNVCLLLSIRSWASPFIVPRGGLGYMHRCQSRGR